MRNYFSIEFHYNISDNIIYVCHRYYLTTGNMFEAEGNYNFNETDDFSSLAGNILFNAGSREGQGKADEIARVK